MIHIIFSTLLIAMMLIDAYLDAKRIKQGKWIDHSGGAIIVAVISIIVAVVLCFIFQVAQLVNFTIYLISWPVIVRLAVFDFSLNFFRGLSLFYQSTTTTDDTDRVERKLGINENVVRFISLAILITSFFFHNQINNLIK